MKKITLFTTLTLSIVFLLNSGAQPATQNLLKVTKAQETDSITPVSDYKKSADSLLDIAEKNNVSAYLTLEKVKELQNLKESQNKEIQVVRKKIKNNLKLTLEIYKQKVREQKIIDKEHHNEILINNEVYKIDSTYRKGNLLRKGKWSYEITFPDGNKRKIE